MSQQLGRNNCFSCITPTLYNPPSSPKMVNWWVEHLSKATSDLGKNETMIFKFENAIETCIDNSTTNYRSY